MNTPLKIFKKLDCMILNIQFHLDNRPRGEERIDGGLANTVELMGTGSNC